MIFACLLREDYRATSVSMQPFAIAQRGCVVGALFAPTQDIVISNDVEAFIRIIARVNGSQRPIGNLRLGRGKYKADEPVTFKLNSSTTLEGGEMLYVLKEITSGALAIPESLVQVECR